MFCRGGACVGAYDHTPLRCGSFVSPSRSLGAIVRGYKGAVSAWARQNTPVFDIWQRNYHDRIIRDEGELASLREYIINNLQAWFSDPENTTEG